MSVKENTNLRNKVRSGRFFVFTLNNYTDLEEEYLSKKIDKIRYLGFGKETAPSSGTKHLQGWGQLYTATTIKVITKLLTPPGNKPRSHVELATSGIRNNEEYCKKAGEYKSWGQCKQQGRRSDLARVSELCREGDFAKVLEEHGESYIKYPNGIERYRIALEGNRYENARPNYKKREVIFLWGASGIGKTRRAFEIAAEKNGKCFRVPKPNGGKMWFTGILPWHSVALFDEFTGQDWLPYSYFKELADGYKIQIPVHNGLSYWYPETIIFTMNTDPNYLYQIGRDADISASGKDPFMRRVTQIIKME